MSENRVCPNNALGCGQPLVCSVCPTCDKNFGAWPAGSLLDGRDA